MSDGVLDPTIGAINSALNLRLMNQNIISSNIANADTPGYKAKRMEFESALRDALGIHGDLKLDTPEPGHRSPQQVDATYPQIYDDPHGVESLNGNTVDRAKEMALMAENQLLYDAGVEMLRKKIGMMKYALTEGGGGR